MISRIAATGLRYLAARRGRTNLRSSDVDLIAVVELGGLVDVLSVLPALSLLRTSFPSARIVLTVRSSFTALLRAMDTGVEVADGASLRHLRPDLVFSMSPTPATVLASLSSGAPFCIGYLRPSRSGPLHHVPLTVETYGVTLPRAMASQGRHREERGLDVCRALGLPVDGVRRSVRLHDDVLDERRARLAEQGIRIGHPTVAIHPFSGWDYRSWSPAAFGELAARIAGPEGCPVVLLGGPRDEYRIDPLRQRFRDTRRVTVLTTNDLLLMAAIVHDATLFVGNDAAPLWLAAALGVPSVGLFGPSTPVLNAPRSRHVATHYVRVDCSPCDQRRCIRPDDPCINHIGVDEVLRSVTSALHRAMMTASDPALP